MTTSIFQAKFGWHEDESKFNNTTITVTGVIGNMIGALIGGKAIKNGRRKAAIYWLLLAIIGACVTMIGNIPSLCFGRFLVGIAAGVVNNVMGKSLDDTIPVEVSGQFGTLTNFYICVGLFFAFSLGSILPTDEEDLMDDNRWRIIYLMPAFIAIV